MRNFVKTAAAAALMISATGCDILSLLEQELEDLGIDVEATIDDNAAAQASFEATVFAVQGAVFEAVGEELEGPEGEGPDGAGPDGAGPDGPDGPGAMPMEELPDGPGDLPDGPGDISGAEDFDAEFEDINLTQEFDFTTEISGGTLSVAGTITVATDGPDSVQLNQDINVQWTNLTSFDAEGTEIVSDGNMLLQAELTFKDETFLTTGTYRGQMTIAGGTFGYDVKITSDGETVTYSGIVNGEEVNETMSIEDIIAIEEDDGEGGPDGPSDDEFADDGGNSPDSGDCDESQPSNTICIDDGSGTVTAGTNGAYNGAGSAQDLIILVFDQGGDATGASLQIEKTAQKGFHDCSGRSNVNYDGASAIKSFEFYEAWCAIEITSIGTEVGDVVSGYFAAEMYDSSTEQLRYVSGAFNAEIAF